MQTKVIGRLQNGKKYLQYLKQGRIIWNQFIYTNKSQKDISFKWTNRRSYEQTIYKGGNIKTKKHVEMIQIVIRAMELKKAILF